VSYEEELHQPLDREDWETREVYAKFGVAVYFCQVVETGIGTYLALLRRMKSGKTMTPEQVDELMVEVFGNRFGQNIKEIRDLLGNEGKWILDDDMRQALDLRNRLVHHWMRERVLELGTSENREALIEELGDAIKELEEADRVLTERTKRLMEKAGVSLEAVQQDLERLESLSDTGRPDEGAPSYWRRPEWLPLGG
jgi:hypothetical protein